MANDFVSYDVESVSVANTEDNNSLETTQWAYDKNTDIRCGELMTTDVRSDIGEHQLTTPATTGYPVNFICKYAYDASEIDLTQEPVTCFKIQRGVEYVLPESNIHASEAAFTLGDYITNTAGYFDLGTPGAQFMAFQVLSPATRGAGGYFRAIGVCSELPG